MAKEIKNILLNGIHARQLEKYASKYFSGSLTDIGYGTRPYNGLLTPNFKAHIGVDHQETLHDKSNIDRFGTAYNTQQKLASLTVRSALPFWNTLTNQKKHYGSVTACWRRGGALFITSPSSGISMKSPLISIGLPNTD